MTNSGEFTTSRRALLATAGVALGVVGATVLGSQSADADPLEDSFLINAADNGIVSNATLDQTVAVQALVNTITAGGKGGTLYFGRMTVACNMVLTSNIRVLGEGGVRTILKAPPGSNLPVISMSDANQSAITIENVLIDGNKSAQTSSGTAHGIWLNSQGGTSTGDHSVRNVRIQNCLDDGLSIQGSNGGCFIENVYAYSNDRYGIRIESADNIIIGCTAGQSGSEGIYAASSNSRWVACNAYFSGRLDVTNGHGWWIRTQDRQTFVECQAQDNMRYGFYLFEVQSITMVGCVADSNNGSSNTGGGPTGTPNQLASGWGLKNAADCVIQGLALNRFNPTNRQVAPIEFIGTTSTGNDINIQENGTHSTRIVGSWGSNRGHIGNTYYGLVAPTTTLTPSHALGTLTKKVEVFGPDGTSLGFVPIYDTIS